MNFFSLFKRNLIYKFKKKINIDNDDFNNCRLDDLFYYYGSDKSHIFKHTKDKGHGFSKFYEEHLSEYKNKKVRILEIGSYAGASASAFAKYFPNVEIFCFDVNISKFIYSSNKIKVFGLDIKNEKKVLHTIKNISNNKSSNFFDIIIDDGSHNLKDILIGFKILFRYLKSNGIYVIEDYKYPNYFKYNRDVDDILIDQMLLSLKKKKRFSSMILNEKVQLYLINSIKSIQVYEGNFKSSNIFLIKKKN